MGMSLSGQQLLGTFAHSLWLQRPDKATVIQKELQRAQVGITQAPTQKEVIGEYQKPWENPETRGSAVQAA